MNQLGSSETHLDLVRIQSISRPLQAYEILYTCVRCSQNLLELQQTKLLGLRIFK